MEKLTLKEIAEPVGGIVALSLALGLSRGAVSQWNEIPLKRINQVSQLTGYPREQLRPDIFGEQTKEAA